MVSEGSLNRFDKTQTSIVSGYFYASVGNSHSHRGFSPVIRQHTEVLNRFNGFLYAAILVGPPEKTVETVSLILSSPCAPG